MLGTSGCWRLVWISSSFSFLSFLFSGDADACLPLKCACANGLKFELGFLVQCG